VIKNLERMRLINSMLESQIVIPRLIELDYMKACFPLHNMYEFKNEPRLCNSNRILELPKFFIQQLKTN
jgi:hypothetical protein